ncbi:MAG: HAMP domain-containing histidine kinase [Candidatus Obscuribacterales bacterium]|nr:HAMP domain-containing histidine kinase [Candidatus Obscuribacterales bacterium]
MSTLVRLETSAQQETSAKRVVSLVYEISGTMGSTILRTTGSNLFEIAKQGRRVREFVEEVDASKTDLLRLVKGNERATKLAKRMCEHSTRVVEDWAEMFTAYDAKHEKMFFAQFITKQEYLESVKAHLDLINRDTKELLAIYGPVAKELTPKAIEQRAQLKTLIAIAIVTNLILTAVLFFLLYKFTLQRGSKLMTHVQTFATGRETFAPLSGTDEIAELDQIFSKMSEERRKLDQLRQSIREMVNHDMRSPLTSMNIRLESVIDRFGPELPPKVLEHIRQVATETQRLARLANTLLDVDRMEDGKLDVNAKTVPINDIVVGSIAALTGQAERLKVTLETELEPNLSAYCDPDRTIQIITNFLSNALKFSPKGGSTVWITAHAIEDDMIRIEVIDQGKGIPHDEVQNLFTRFKQLSQPDDIRAQGSGLGLFICKSLAEAQGGAIGYREREEPGGCFWIELPVNPSSEEQALMTR